MVIGADSQILQSVGNSAGTPLSFALNIRLSTSAAKYTYFFAFPRLKQIIGWDLFCDFVTECNDEIISPFARRRNVAWFSKESSRFMSDPGKNALDALDIRVHTIE